MANYNPHVPDIVGQEWVPIVGEPYQPDSTIERGYSFTVSRTSGVAPIVASRGLFTLANVPSGVTTSQVPFMSLYEKGNEKVGPIQSLIMECADAVSAGPDGAFFGAHTGGQALRNPSDGSGYDFTSGTAPVSGVLDLSFDINDLATLMGRIHNVSLIYTAAGDGLEQATLPNSMLISLRYRSTDFYYSTGALETGPSFRGDLSKLARISLGEINPQWSNATFTATNDRYPWTRDRLLLFSQASGDPMRIRFAWQAPELNTDLRLYYAALQITYSPVENRVMYGGTHMGIDQCATLTNPNYGFNGDDVRNRVMLRTANTLVTGAGLELLPGEYTVTFHLGDYGDANQPIFNVNAAAATNTRPTVDAVRELYEIPSVNGIEIERAFATTDVIRAEDSHIIPSLGIGITGSAGPGTGDVYSGCHGYFAPLPGDAISVGVPEQDFRSDNKDGLLPYPWIRFYARQTNGPVDNPNVWLETTIVSTPAGSPAALRITAPELNALPEIFDGWREVTLRYPAGREPYWDGDAVTQRTVQWFAGGVSIDLLAAFQVLGAQTGLSFSNAAYQGHIGALTGGFFPLSSGATGDYTFLFSTDPPAITGIGVSTQSVPLTGIGTECGIVPQCVPTALPCNRVTWTLPHGQTVISDNFERAVSSGWGTSTSGQTWTTTGGSASDYSVQVSGAAIHSVGSIGVPRTSLIGPTTIRDFDITTRVNIGTTPVTQPNSASIIGRWVDANNFYEFRMEWRQEGTLRDTQVSIRRTLAGSDLILANTQMAFTNIGTTDFISMRAQAQGTTLRFKVWNAQSDGEPEPELWQVVATDTSFVQGQVGLRSQINSLSTVTLPVIFTYNYFNVRPSDWNFGYYELQRSDDDTPWQTIMKATSPEVSGFSDFEARISMRSDYRIRQVNVYDFPGLWSPIVSNTLPSPVTGTGADSHELLTFTTNTNQTHGQSLAYEEVWENNPSQEMTYFEGDGMMQFQRMYNRNYQVGFHSLERGGVQFTRTLLVQNAAVSAPILENAFVSMRDLAWDALPYVCVRTNQGDRWYAAVEVPSGNVSRKRRLQLVQVKITEVADEPYPVDPPGVPDAV